MKYLDWSFFIANLVCGGLAILGDAPSWVIAFSFTVSGALLTQNLYTPIIDRYREMVTLYQSNLK